MKSPDPPWRHRRSREAVLPILPRKSVHRKGVFVRSGDRGRSAPLRSPMHLPHVRRRRWFLVDALIEQLSLHSILHTNRHTRPASMLRADMEGASPEVATTASRSPGPSLGPPSSESESTWNDPAQSRGVVSAGRGKNVSTTRRTIGSCRRSARRVLTPTYVAPHQVQLRVSLVASASCFFLLECL